MKQEWPTGIDRQVADAMDAFNSAMLKIQESGYDISLTEVLERPKSKSSDLKYVVCLSITYGKTK